MELMTPPTRKITDVSYDFRGRTVIVTGAGRGLGRSHAQAFSAAGASVVLCSRGADDLAATAESCHAASPDSEVLALTCDVSRERDVAATIEATVSTFG